MANIDQNRRKWLGYGAITLGFSLLPRHAFAALTTPRSKILRFENLHTGEFLKTEFFDGHSYIYSINFKMHGKTEKGAYYSCLLLDRWMHLEVR